MAERAPSSSCRPDAVGPNFLRARPGRPAEVSACPASFARPGADTARLRAHLLMALVAAAYLADGAALALALIARGGLR